MAATQSALWGTFRLLSHGIGLQVPPGANGVNQTESIWLTAARCQLRPGQYGLSPNWLGTLNLPCVPVRRLCRPSRASPATRARKPAWTPPASGMAARSTTRKPNYSAREWASRIALVSGRRDI